MKRTVWRHSKRDRPADEAGFTLTELVAGLLVASALIMGLAEITRRYVSTTVRVKDIAADLRTVQLLNNLMAEFQRIDPGSLDVAPDRVTARIGANELAASLAAPVNGVRILEWSSPSLKRSIRLPATARFEQMAAGAIVLIGEPGAPPLALGSPARAAPFDCQFDTVIRDCR